jgi:hypothetical protein
MTSTDETILVFAFRYALGRRSTAPGIISDVLIKRWNEMHRHARYQVQSEIEAAIDRGEAGQPCDVETWKKVLALPNYS